MAKATFEAEDGSQHATEERADKRNELLKAKESFRNAALRVQRLLAENGRTADGKPFSWSGWCNGYAIIGRYGHCPHIVEVNCYPYTTEVEIDRDDESITFVVDADNDAKRTRIKITELYASRENAEAALLVKLDEWLKWKSGEAADVRKAIAERRAR